ncbi:MAG: metallophosphoesterase [Opitutaceae bacterium]
MKILVVPDIHENLEFLKYIFAYEDTASFDHIVLLGDYFDQPGVVQLCEKKLQQVAGTLLGFKEIFGERLHMLCGNHDLPYYALQPACGDNRGQPNQIISQWLGNTTLDRAEIINELWDEAFWLDLKGAVLLDGWLFSHAGVHPNWWTRLGKTTATRYRAFQKTWESALENIFNEAENPIFAAGEARGGIVPVGGPLWLDWDKEFEDALEVPQIVGHTRCAKQTQKGRSYCIDFAQAAYAIIENEEVQLNIWPKSWLGESMLDSV